MHGTADYWIEKLSLQPHPEGGYYKETYRSIEKAHFSTIKGDRNASTAIYFLLTSDVFSAFHRIKSDEMWHFYDGDPLSVYVFLPSGELQIIRLGLDIEKNEYPQAVVPAGCWFASRVEYPGHFSLVGCTVSPGFDFQDFEMASRDKLLKECPQHEQLIRELTRTG